jgi:Domain of unknown function (DUF4185)
MSAKVRVSSLTLSCVLASIAFTAAFYSFGQSDEPEQSTFFSTASEESYSTYQLAGDGDLWPSCWADDDALYTANGDGTAFNDVPTRYDMAVSRISGEPPSLSGKTIATDVGSNWSGPHYNRKPTGMLCVHGAIYLAFQNLDSSHFDDAPAASIAKSTDHGVTWTWDRERPMFGTPDQPHGPLDHLFTTVFFADFGKASRDETDNYVYAYGLDQNWRSQQELFLARVLPDHVLDRAAWEFFAGSDSSGNPRWDKDILRKRPVLTDRRLLYHNRLRRAQTDCNADQRVIGQGGVVFDAPLRRFIFSSWACATHEFFESPAPWGPWRHFLSTDFGNVRSTQHYGQYGTSIPSKFISADGKTLYLQSNVWTFAYTFALRKLYLQPYASSAPTNEASDANLALTPGTRAISKSTHFGLLCGRDCFDLLIGSAHEGSEDDFDDEAKALSWWGYTWPQALKLNRVVYRTGECFPDGGWFGARLHVQVRQNFRWIDVSALSFQPPYPHRSTVGEQVYTLNFDPTWGDGVRIVGEPGGSSHFTSISQLGVYYVK